MTIPPEFNNGGAIEAVSIVSLKVKESNHI